MSLKSRTIAAAAAAVLSLSAHAGVALAQMSHEGHGAAPQAQPGGVAIREASVQGYTFSYRLYSWEERNAMMKGMEGHRMPGMDDTGKATNHLMLFVKDSKGAEVSGAKVGFQIVGPDKARQTTLTMGMSGGYGADVILKPKGDYAVKTKVEAGSKTLTEDFTYTVK